MDVIKILIMLLVAISIFYTITYLDWKHNVFPFTKEEETEYRKLLCDKLGLNYVAFQEDSIESLEEQINPKHWNINDLKKTIKSDNELKIFGRIINELDITLRELFFRKKVESKHSKYLKNTTYTNNTLFIFYFCPIWFWEKTKKYD